MNLLKDFFKPLEISFTDAILVAVIGLVVNLICVMVMGGHHHHHDCHHSHEKENENLNF